jgi:Ecdysteroid kinase-like family
MLISPEVLRSPEQVTAAYVSEAVRAAGELLRGSAERVEHTPPWRGGSSLVYPLRITYSPDAPAAAPRRLVLKVPRPDVAAPVTARNARQEFGFYARLAPQMPAVPTVRCYAGAHEPARGAYHVVLADLSATHAPPRDNVPPAEPLCAAAVRSLARLHAHWWQHPRLGRDLGTPRPAAAGEAGLATAMANNERAIGAFLDYLGPELPPAWRRRHPQCLAFLPQVRRSRVAGPVTLTHGDPQWRNFLLPRDSARGTARLFDWQTWDAGVPMDDLWYMIGRHWFPEPRPELVERLLRHYHTALLGAGVAAAGYPWGRCWDDFRVALLRSPLSVTTGWQRRGTPGDPRALWAQRVVWSWMLVDALHCAELVA